MMQFKSIVAALAVVFSGAVLSLVGSPTAVAAVPLSGDAPDLKGWIRPTCAMTAPGVERRVVLYKVRNTDSRTRTFWSGVNGVLQRHRVKPGTWKYVTRMARPGDRLVLRGTRDAPVSMSMSQPCKQFMTKTFISSDTGEVVTWIANGDDRMRTFPVLFRGTNPGGKPMGPSWWLRSGDDSTFYYNAALPQGVLVTTWVKIGGVERLLTAQVARRH